MGARLACEYTVRRPPTRAQNTQQIYTYGPGSPAWRRGGRTRERPRRRRPPIPVMPYAHVKKMRSESPGPESAERGGGKGKPRHPPPHESINTSRTSRSAFSIRKGSPPSPAAMAMVCGKLARVLRGWTRMPVRWVYIHKICVRWNGRGSRRVCIVYTYTYHTRTDLMEAGVHPAEEALGRGQRGGDA